jgi:hypothetical protein
MMRIQEITRPRGNESPAFWRQGDFRLFITHLTNHSRFAIGLQRALSAYHISSFVAHKDVRPAEDWNQEVLWALRTANALLALIHEGFHESEWTGQEAGFALGRGRLVLAIKMGEEPPGFLGRVQALDGQGKSIRWLARQVFMLLKEHKKTRRLMVKSLVHGFETSGDVSEAKDNIELLEDVFYWEPQMSDRIRRAVSRNPWIENAWRVPERVEKLIHQRTASSPPPLER